MATAELAAALPVLVLLLGAVLAAVSLAGDQVRAMDAAREAARALARGDPGAAERYGRMVAPQARIVVSRAGPQVTAEARLSARPLGGLLPQITIVERAVAAAEPDGSP